MARKSFQVNIDKLVQRRNKHKLLISHESRVRLEQVLLFLQQQFALRLLGNKRAFRRRKVCIALMQKTVHDCFPKDAAFTKQMLRYANERIQNVQ